MHPAPISWKSTREAIYSNYMGLFFYLFLFCFVFFYFFFVFSLLFLFFLYFFFFFLFVFVYCCFYLIFEIFFLYTQKVKWKKEKVARFSKGQQPQIKVLPSITSTLKYPFVNHVGESQSCWGINHYN